MVQAVKLSIEEYHRIVATGLFSDRRIELIEGELVELSPETPNQANHNHKLYKYLLSIFNTNYQSPIYNLQSTIAEAKSDFFCNSFNPVFILLGVAAGYVGSYNHYSFVFQRLTDQSLHVLGKIIKFYFPGIVF